MAAGRSGIETMLGLMDEAFRGRGIEASNESQGLLTNLATVTNAQWRARPAGVARAIEAIAVHVGACKLMYEDYAFGPGTWWFGPAVEPWPEGGAPMGEVIACLGTAHETLRSRVAALAGDAELDVPRPTNWGELRPTRWILAAMVTHDAYHAGEINHLRSILSGDDRWRHVQLGFG